MEISTTVAIIMLKDRIVVAENAFVEMVLWQLPQPLRGSPHRFKYRLAFIQDGVCVLRYDNEQGKGDHKHIGQTETLYRFITPQALLNDFWRDVDDWRQK